MPKLKRNRLPSYRRHKARGLAVVTLNVTDIYLGPYGTESSKFEYDRVIAEWIANGRQISAPDSPTRPDLTITELIARYWGHATQYYTKAGKPTSEQWWIRLAMRPLRRLYGETRASEFGPLALKAIRENMIEGGAARTTVNGYVARIKRMFRWAVENELVAAEAYQRLQAVAGLRRGRSEARETDPVSPVSDAFVYAIRPFVSRQTWVMIELQWLAGLRPGEVVNMRTRDIDMSGAVWQYRPASHKTEHRGHGRIVELGPRAQRVIQPFLTPDVNRFLFSPTEAESERAVNRRRRRKTPVQPSQRDRRKRNQRRSSGEYYTVASYRRAI